MVERQFTTKLKNVQTDSGGEFRNLASFFSSLEIIHRRSCPYISEQNGFVERCNRHVVETGLTLLAQACVPQLQSVSTDQLVSTALHQSTDKQEQGTDKPDVSTDGTKLSTDSEKEGTDKPELKTSDAPTVQTPTPPTPMTSTTLTLIPTTFGNDETIAQVLLNMSQAKAISKEKEKGVEFKDVGDSERPRTTSTRFVLTLKPLPKIDPKDKGKKVLEKEDESEAESEREDATVKKVKQLANDEEVARKIKEEWVAEEERKRIAEEEATKDAQTNEYDLIQARIEADRLLCERIQEAEREQFTVEERARFLHDTIAAQRRFLAQRDLNPLGTSHQ
ncbi:retrovirus-related pol polyprotein from transposon TNT 1-94 [Tanacetum coccineum]